jgi:hypothetical protein
MVNNYVVNQVISRKGKRIILLLDSYTPKSKRNLNVVDTSPGFSFSASQDELSSIRKSYKDVKVFGFWSLLYDAKLLDLIPEENSFVVYTNDSKTEGLYLYYNRLESQFNTGLVVNGNVIGSFGFKIDDAHVIDANIDELELVNEILLPIEVKRNKQQFYQKIAIQNVVVTILAIIIAVVFNIMIVNKDSNIKAIKKSISKTDRANKDRRAEILKLSINNIPKNLEHISNFKTIEPLVELANLRTKGVNFEAPIKDGEVSFEIANTKKLPLWLAGLSKNFKFIENGKTIKIRWEK